MRHRDLSPIDLDGDTHGEERDLENEQIGKK